MNIRWIQVLCICQLCSCISNTVLFAPKLVIVGEQVHVVIRRPQKKFDEDGICQTRINSTQWQPVPTIFVDSSTVQCVVLVSSTDGIQDVMLVQNRKKDDVYIQLQVINQPSLVHWGPQKVSNGDEFILKFQLKEDPLLRFLRTSDYTPVLKLIDSISNQQFTMASKLFTNKGEMVFAWMGEPYIRSGSYHIKLFLVDDLEIVSTTMEKSPVLEVMQPMTGFSSPYYEYDFQRNRAQVILLLNIPRLTDVEMVIQVQDQQGSWKWNSGSSGIGIVEFENLVFNETTGDRLALQIVQTSAAVAHPVTSRAYIVKKDSFKIPTFSLPSRLNVYRSEQQVIHIKSSFTSRLRSELWYEISSDQEIPPWIMTSIRDSLFLPEDSLMLQVDWTEVQLYDRLTLNVKLFGKWNALVDPDKNNVTIEVLGVEPGSCPPGAKFRNGSKVPSKPNVVISPLFPFLPIESSQLFPVQFEGLVDDILQRIDVNPPFAENDTNTEYECPIPFGAKDVQMVLRNEGRFFSVLWRSCPEAFARQPVQAPSQTKSLENRYNLPGLHPNTSCQLEILLNHTITQKNQSQQVLAQKSLSSVGFDKLRISLKQLANPSHADLRSLWFIAQEKYLLCGSSWEANNESRLDWFMGECNPKNSMFVNSSTALQGYVVPMLQYPEFGVADLNERQLQVDLRQSNRTEIIVTVTAEDRITSNTYSVTFGASFEYSNFGEKEVVTSSIENLCTDCPAGTYSSFLNSYQCISCLPGTYSDVERSIQCNQCPAGSFSKYYGSTQCTQCLYGTFSSHNGSSICDVCQKGTVTLFEGSVKCVDKEVYAKKLSKEFQVVVSFALWLNDTSWQDIDSKTIDLGVNASSDTIVSLLLQADTARIFNISFQDVEVTDIQEVINQRSLSENSTAIKANVTATLHKDCNRSKKKEYQECVELMRNDADQALYELSGHGAMRQIDSVLDVEAELDEDEYYVEEHPALRKKVPTLEIVLLPTLSGFAMAVVALGIWIKVKRKQTLFCGWMAAPKYKQHI